MKLYFEGIKENLGLCEVYMQKDWATPTLLFGNMIMWKRKKQQINWMRNVCWYCGERIDKRSNILWGDNKSRDYLHAALSADSINLTIKMAVLLKTLFLLFFLTGIGLFNKIWEDFNISKLSQCDLIILWGNVHTVPDKFSTGGKFVRLGVSFTWNHAKRTKIWTPKRLKLWTRKSKTNF